MLKERRKSCCGKVPVQSPHPRKGDSRKEERAGRGSPRAPAGSSQAVFALSPVPAPALISSCSPAFPLHLPGPGNPCCSLGMLQHRWEGK